MRLCVLNLDRRDVTVDLNTFLDAGTGRPSDPFDRRLRVRTVKSGQRKCTQIAEDGAPTKRGRFKYSVTARFSDGQRVDLDPDVIID
jgi:hypothetical protein